MPNRNPRVLIVDDSDSSRATLASALVDENYEIHFATSGYEGIEMASHLTPDVILMDHMMPGMTGAEACRIIRSDPDLAEIPIIFVTALDDRSSRLTAFEAGADEVVSKPVDRLEIRMRVRNIIRLNRYRNLVQGREDVIRMLSQVRSAYDATIVGWARALELRNAETKGHSERVSAWTVDLAVAAGVEGELLDHLYRGALLHDIGKMGVPDAILLKPGPLTPEERQEMERHPEFARDLLTPIEYLAPAIDVAYCHHERWDGAGYPRGLVGEEIPMSARLFSVVDVYDALTSDRPYREAWKPDRVLQYLEEQANKQFDPRFTFLFCEQVRTGVLRKPSAVSSVKEAPLS